MESQIQDWRRRHHLTQAALARQMGLSPATLSQKEHGKLAWQHRDLRFFKTRGLSADYVLGFDSNPGHGIRALSEVERTLLRLVAGKIAQHR